MNRTYPAPGSAIRWRLGAYSLILLGFFLRLYRLNDIAVEKSEMTNINWFIRGGLISVLTENKALNNHPLNSVLGYLTSSLGYESIFTLRWHSVVLGVLGVAVIYRLGREWLDNRNGLIAGLLVSASAYHVALSQIARGYVGLITLTSLGFYFTWLALKTGRKRYWLGFTLISILNIYNHLYGALAVAVIGLIGAAFVTGRILKAPSPRRAVLPFFLPLATCLVSIYTISAGLYLPMWSDTVSVAGQSNQFRESDLRHEASYSPLQKVVQPVYEGIRPFSLAKDATRLRLADPTYRYGPFDPLAQLAENRFGFYLALITFLLGLFFSWQRFPRATLVLLAWLLLPFVLQMGLDWLLPGAYYRGRFMAFIYPPYLLLMAQGWPGLAGWLANKRGPLVLKSLSRSAGWAGLGVLLALNLAWLTTFYLAAIHEQWPAVADHILQDSQENDLVMCGQRPKTACTFDLSTRLKREVQASADLLSLDTLRSSRAELEQPGRVWMVMPHLVPWQVRHLENETGPPHFWLTGNPRYDQTGWLLIDGRETLADNLAEALQLTLALSLSDEASYDNYLGLGQFHLARNELDMAELLLEAAEALLPDGEGYWGNLQEVKTQLEYARQAARPVAGLPDDAIWLDLEFDNLARLLVYRVDTETVSPGQTLSVELYWQPLARIKRDLVSYVHLTDLEANLLGQARGVPGAGQAPATSWSPGEIVIDAYTLTVDPAATTPLAARLEAGLFDPNHFEFIKPTASGPSKEAGSTTITHIKVMPEALPASEPAYALEANFAGLISLTGYSLVADPPGIAFYWQVEEEMDEDYVVFVHLLDAGELLIGQLDGPPVYGNYPTSWWSLGEIILDQRVDEAVAAAEALLVGWYRLGDGSRLPLADGSGDSIRLDIGGW